MRIAACHARLRTLGVALALLICGPCRSADAPPTAQDVQIAGRVLTFQEGVNGGSVRVAIAYDPAQPTSTHEARALADLLGRGVTIGSLTLTGELVDQGHLGGAQFGAIFAAAGVDPAIVLAATRQHAAPCVTRQLELVSSGACTVAIRTTPGVAIYFSSANASSASVTFATAFIMMVHEL